MSLNSQDILKNLKESSENVENSLNSLYNLQSFLISLQTQNKRRLTSISLSLSVSTSPINVSSPPKQTPIFHQVSQSLPRTDGILLSSSVSLPQTPFASLDSSLCPIEENETTDEIKSTSTIEETLPPTPNSPFTFDPNSPKIIYSPNSSSNPPENNLRKQMFTSLDSSPISNQPTHQYQRSQIKTTPPSKITTEITSTTNKPPEKTKPPKSDTSQNGSIILKNFRVGVSDEQHTWHFTITHTIHHSSFDSYIIEVRHNRELRRIVKRYSELRALHDKLLRDENGQYSSNSLPVFPKKKYFGKQMTDFVEKRKKQLENYLNALPCSVWFYSEYAIKFLNTTLEEVPKEIGAEREITQIHHLSFRIVEEFVCHIIKNGLKSVGIFRVSGGQAKINQLYSKLDTSPISFLGVSIFEVAGTLQLYFRQQNDSLIPYNIYKNYINMNDPNPINYLVNLIRDMEELNQRIFLLLLHLLFFVSYESETNLMNSKNLGIVLGSCLMWDNSGDIDVRSFLRCGFILKEAIDSFRELRNIVEYQPSIYVQKEINELYGTDPSVLEQNLEQNLERDLEKDLEIKVDDEKEEIPIQEDCVRVNVNLSEIEERENNSQNEMIKRETKDSKNISQSNEEIDNKEIRERKISSSSSSSSNSNSNSNFNRFHDFDTEELQPHTNDWRSICYT